MLRWILVDPQGELLALGSYQRVLEAGEEFGCISRKWCPHERFEHAPQPHRGFMMVPAAMFPELAKEFDG